MSSSAQDKNRATTPDSVAFVNYISQGWAAQSAPTPKLNPVASYAAKRRKLVSKAFPGERLVVPAGGLKSRANDTDYPFRAHSSFTYLTGWAAETEPDSILVFEPNAEAHEVTLFFRSAANRNTTEFYRNTQIGEFWVGPRPTLTEVSASLGIQTRPLAEFSAQPGRVIREAEPKLTAKIDALREGNTATTTNPAEADLAADNELHRVIGEMRLVKDEFELAELRAAVAATARGFDDIRDSLKLAISTKRGERVVEGVFHSRARVEGNDVGYGSIAAAGPHATILHWTRNDGQLRPGELILVDAGVEMPSYYTADITRSFPISGVFSPVQREIYQAVLDAADAAFEVVRPGIIFHAIHTAAMRVIESYTRDWGFAPTDDPNLPFYRRYMVHGTSHHLGLDVHDCASARREYYHNGTLATGMVFTIEPGLYFQSDDLTVPPEFRGIGVRIEDNVLVTETGAENLSISIPRTLTEVERWLNQPQ